MRRALLFVCLMMAIAPACAAAPDERLPLAQAFNDESGRPVHLRDYFDDVPVVLVLGYFECPNLCSTVMDGVLEGLARAGLPASSYRLLAISIDPREGAANARRRMGGYRPLRAHEVDAHFLTGAAAASGAVAASIGFPIRWDAEHAQYVHPAGFVVAMPSGRVARHFDGVRFDARDVRLALVEASAGRVGSLGDRLLLFCSHYDPQSGRYNFAAMTAVRLVGGVVALSLGIWVWRRRGGPGA